MQVVKADGTTEAFSDEKVLKSIKRSGVSEDVQKSILNLVKSKVYDGIPTYDIYALIAEALGHSQEPFGKARYSLKQALMLLGPTGYPFENFIARVLQEYGYTTQTRQVLMGRCISHEIDVVAEKPHEKIMVEAKFHNSLGARSDVQTSLYVNSRFIDLREKHNFSKSWLVTNTKATTDAIAYAECAGMQVLSWDYPQTHSLRDMIEEKNIHPVTILSTLSIQHKSHLMANHIILCKDLIKNKGKLRTLNLSSNDQQQVLSELDYITTTALPRISPS